MQVIRIHLVVCIHIFAIFIVGTESQCPSPCHCHGDLQHVICDNVGLKKIPRVTEASRLVNLQRNNLGMLPTGGFSEMKGLVSLHLQHCQIREIANQAFKGLKKLIYLYLSNNEISTIKPGAFDDLTELTYLYLDGNRISSLSKGIFSPMINLFILQLDNNKIRDLQPGTFTGAKVLRLLHISNNDLRSMQPGSLDEVENLATLTLNQNKLSTYPLEALSKLRVVEELNLSKNPLTFIPDYAFRSFGRYIEKLHLNDMVLEKFSNAAFEGVTALKSLHLENNKLKTLPSNLVFTNMQNLTMFNNPWNCNCNLADLKKWMDSSRHRPDAICASPQNQKGKQIRDSNVFIKCKKGKDKKGARH
ncbi:chondroadherin [Clarias gariepinus]|uniref:chondroadherin n=1 Tax=Clarias gariepinus TaxID=13013 RepID=UPI00234E1F5D|nr:chondroadherin [Clarias gariepinus]